MQDRLPGIVAVSDVHSPLYLEAYRRSLAMSGYSSVDVVVFAGDMVERNMVSALKPVEEATRSSFPDAVIIAVFGNDEFMDHEDEYKRYYPGIKWVDDELLTLDINGYKLGIVGSRGVIDRPTPWQRRNISNIDEIYAERIRRLDRLLAESKSRNDITILVTHYASASCTLRGEPRRAWPGIYSRRVESLLRRHRPNAAIHGHAHKGIPQCTVDGVPVYNVAFPVTRRPVKIRYTIKLLDYLRNIRPRGEHGPLHPGEA